MFVHLHNHSIYSLLDGAIAPAAMASEAKKLGMSAVAITDHGSMAGVVEFYKACKEEGIKPIIGCEVYTVPYGKDITYRKDKYDYRHLILLAKNWDGYVNLCRIVSRGWTEGFYQKPRVDFETIKKWHENIICLSACLAGELPHMIMAGKADEALTVAREFKDLFGDDYYIEVQDHHMQEDIFVNAQLVKIAKKIGAKVVATNDCHYLHKSDAGPHEVLLCIQSQKKMTDEKRMRFSTEEYYFKTEDEMRELFPQEYLDNTMEVADKCNVELLFGVNHLPDFGHPKEFKTDAEFFEHICWKGLYERYKDPPEEYKERLRYEIGVIEQMNFVGYFLIVQDFINWAKDHGILVGPGRGSAAGSIACYCMKITEIDPMKHDLLFERFLNPERISMPDIDVDFPDSKRYQVIDYVKERYGYDHVTQIATFTQMQAKSCFKSVARVMGIEYDVSKKIASMIPDGMSLEEAYDEMESLQKALTPPLKKVYKIAESLQGNLSSSSKHAGGVLIADAPVTDYAPLMMTTDKDTKEKFVVVQYQKGDLESMGLIKNDFLGLKTLTVIDDAVGFIRKNHGVDIDINHIDPGKYPEVCAMLVRENTIGVFQFESDGMIEMLNGMFYDIDRLDKAKTDEERYALGSEFFERLVAGISLYRPGPMEYISEYVRGVRDPSTVKYDVPELKPIIGTTYGVIVYQEQVQQIFRSLAGYSLGRADIIRRAISKKHLDIINKEKKIFMHGNLVNGVPPEGEAPVPGCEANGIPLDKAEIIWQKIEKFASYAFNKSHAAAYAFVSFQTAFLKKYYPVEYMASFLTSVMGDAEKRNHYINLCTKVLGIKICPPDLNISERGFTPVDGQIRFGLAGITDVGVKAVNVILEERKNGPFKSLFDFCVRMRGKRVTSKCIIALIRAGAFDFTGLNRRELEINVDDFMKAASKVKEETGLTIFDFIDSEMPEIAEPTFHHASPWSMAQLLANEKKTISMYVSGEPLDCVKDSIAASGINKLSECVSGFERYEKSHPGASGRVFTACMVEDGKEIITKKKNRMFTGVLEDGDTQCDVVAFSRALESGSCTLMPGSAMTIAGTISRHNGRVQIIADEALMIPDDSLGESQEFARIVSMEMKRIGYRKKKRRTA